MARVRKPVSSNSNSHIKQIPQPEIQVTYSVQVSEIRLRQQIAGRSLTVVQCEHSQSRLPCMNELVVFFPSFSHFEIGFYVNES